MLSVVVDECYIGKITGSTIRSPIRNHIRPKRDVHVRSSPDHAYTGRKGHVAALMVMPDG